MKRYAHLREYLVHFFLGSEMFQTKFVEKIRTHFIFSNFFSENRAFYEVMWKKSVEQGRPQIT